MAAGRNVAGGLADAPLESRLDAIDQLLLGCVPRGERQAIVADLEDRLRRAWINSAEIPIADGMAVEALAGRPAAALRPLPLVANEHPEFHQQSSSWPAGVSSRIRRSKLAIASAILGLTAGGLLFASPIAYGVSALLAEMLDETLAIIALCAYVALILSMSTGAIAAGVIALWRLRRQQTEIVGRGWAITGLCTGPIPLGITGLITLFIGLQFLGEMGVSGLGATYAPPAASVPVAGGPVEPVPAASLPLQAYAAPTEPTSSIPLALEPSPGTLVPTSPVPAEPQMLPATHPAPMPERSSTAIPVQQAVGLWEQPEQSAYGLVE
jgi:hypothetical protein